MRLRIGIAALLLSASIASAQTADVRPTFTEQEAQAAIALWEAGLKSMGDQAAEAYVVLTRKVRAAATEAKRTQVPQPPEPPK